MNKILLAIAILLLLVDIGQGKDNPLQLTIKSDKEIFEAGEDITIQITVKNESDTSIFINPESIDLNVSDKSKGINMIAPYFTAKVSIKPPSTNNPNYIEIKSGDTYIKTFNFENWEIHVQEKGQHLGAAYKINEFPNLYSIRGIYSYEQGGLASKPITIEIVEKVKK